MVRTSPWPTFLGTAALIALPVLAAAQTGSTGTQSPPTAQSDKAYPSTAGAATHHLTEAKQVLDSIPRDAVTGPNASKLNQVRRHFAALQKSYSANPSATAAKSAKSSKAKGASAGWNTHLMALDRELNALLGSSGSSSSETSATGTSGTSAGAAASGSLDADVRSKLEEFRKHITEFAAAASGTSASGSMSSSASSSSATEPTSTTQTETATTGQPTSPTSTPTQTSSATGETQQATQQPGTSSTSAAQPDANAAREHLTQARQSLADLTALPQAQQLQGEARTQVSQLISQFNQLITTQADWRSSYDQVNATLTSLIGSANASASTSTSSTQGAVGTSGSTTATLDPAIKSKLEEFRVHLQAFFTAAGGEAGASAGSMSSSGSTSATGTTGSSSSMGTAGTSGSTSATAASGDVESHIAAIEQILSQAGAGAGASSSATGSSATGSSTSSTGAPGSTGATGSTGSTGSMSGTAGKPSGSSVTLTQEQIDQIRMHLQAIRSSVKK